MCSFASVYAWCQKYKTILITFFLCSKNTPSNERLLETARWVEERQNELESVIHRRPSIAPLLFCDLCSLYSSHRIKQHGLWPWGKQWFGPCCAVGSRLPQPSALSLCVHICPHLSKTVRYTLRKRRSALNWRFPFMSVCSDDIINNIMSCILYWKRNNKKRGHLHYHQLIMEGSQIIPWRASHPAHYPQHEEMWVGVGRDGSAGTHTQKHMKGIAYIGGMNVTVRSCSLGGFTFPWLPLRRTCYCTSISPQHSKLSMALSPPSIEIRQINTCCCRLCSHVCVFLYRLYSIHLKQQRDGVLTWPIWSFFSYKLFFWKPQWCHIDLPTAECTL